MATVTLRDVKKSFGSTHVIHGIDLEVDDGEFIVIVGPSGCGKSTLLRMVAGLETVSSGEVQIGGLRANEKEPMDRDIAMVFQNYALYPHMSVRQNMGYGLKIAGMAKPEINRKVEEAAELLQLGSLWDVQSFESRRFFCLTSHCRTWMRNCVSKCVLRLRSCNQSSELRLFM